MNLALEKGEHVTMGGKCRGEIRIKLEKSMGWLHTTDKLGKGTDLVDGGLQLENWRYCWWLLGLIWTELQRPNMSTCMSISRKMTWEG